MNLVLLLACVTHCGLLSDIADCEGLQRLENQTLLVLAEAHVWSYAQGCSALNGWQVREHVRTELDWEYCGGRGFRLITEESELCVDGYAWVFPRILEITPRDWWDDHPLPHELIHAIDETLTGRRGHCRWTRRGIKRVLRQVTGFVDHTPEICLDGK